MSPYYDDYYTRHRQNMCGSILRDLGKSSESELIAIVEAYESMPFLRKALAVLGYYQSFEYDTARNLLREKFQH